VTKIFNIQDHKDYGKHTCDKYCDPYYLSDLGARFFRLYCYSKFAGKKVTRFRILLMERRTARVARRFTELLHKRMGLL